MVRDSLSILVVDDMKFSCEFVRRALVSEGFQTISVANSAREALKHIEQEPVDVILADWLMPEMDGIELTQTIRHLDEQRNHYTGIVLLTAKDDTESIRHAFEEGVDDYLVKPPNQVELAARIYAAGRVATMQNDLLDTTRTLHRLFELKCKVDQITGLGRLEDTQHRLDELLQQTQSRGGATCCAVLKIHEFDEIADNQGIQVQEQLLNSVANRITRLVRPMDLIGHIKKDEFLIALYYPQKEDARCRSFKRIMHDVNHRSFKTTEGFVNINCAMAMTTVDKDSIPESVKQLIRDTRKKLTKSIEMGFEDVAT